jgi:hypothetical protein
MTMGMVLTPRRESVIAIDPGPDRSGVVTLTSEGEPG